MSPVIIVNTFAFFVRFNFIIHYYYAYVNAFILVHLSVFELGSIGLALAHFSLTRGTGVPKKFLFLLVLIKVD